MNFIEEYKKGQKGGNKGLPTGLAPLNKAIDGVQRKSIYGVGGSPKTGKTAFVDQCFVIMPYLHMVDNPHIEIDWIYFSFEIDRLKKAFKYTAFFFWHDHGIKSFVYNDKTYELNARYLLGKMEDDHGNVIPVNKEHFEVLKEIYYKRIVPIFGEYNVKGQKIKQGVVDFIEQKENPTGLRNYLLNYARQNGEFIKEPYTVKDSSGQRITRERLVGYKPHNPEKYVIIITDHIRKPTRERGFTLKENIDKYIEYQVELRNLCGYTFVDIAHLHRGISNTDRIRFMSEFLYPTGDDFKDTGNISEEADYVITLFNPQDEKYNIKKHFGLELENYPNYRSIHIVESRDTECPLHLRANMFGNINLFVPIN